MAEYALSGVKVVDLTHYIMGPYCTKLLAHQGAEVIKVERPNGGDPARRLGPFAGDDPHPEKSGLFLNLNTNKKSITLNLKTATGQKVFKELVRDADIVVENFAPRVMPSLGLSYEELAKVNPNLVMTSISNFGKDGPYRDYKLSEITLYALGGVMYSTGMPEREPQKLSLTVIQMQAGQVAAVATLGALFSAQFHGVGQHVDVAAAEVTATLMDRAGPGLVAVAYSGSSDYMYRARSRRTTVVLGSGNVPVMDGYIAWNASSWEWFDRFARWLDRPDLLTDPRFDAPEKFYLANNPEGAEYMDSILLPHLFSRTKQEIMMTAQAQGLAVTALQTPADVFTDPQLEFRKFWVEVEHPVAGTFKYPGDQFHMSETSWKADRAPLLGEHNEEILCGRLGYTKEDLVRLRELGII